MNDYFREGFEKVAYRSSANTYMKRNIKWLKKNQDKEGAKDLMGYMGMMEGSKTLSVKLKKKHGKLMQDSFKAQFKG